MDNHPSPDDRNIHLKSPARVRIGSGQSLVVAVPHLLGFHPEDSLVAVAVDRNLCVVVTLRVDLAALASPQGAASIVARLLPSGASAVVFVAYDRGPLRHPEVNKYAQALATAAELAGLVCIDVAHAVAAAPGSRRLNVASLLCSDPACCPPSGHGVDPEADDLLITAEFVGAGSFTFSSRDEMIAPLHTPSSNRAAVEEHVEKSLDRALKAVRAGADFECWRDGCVAALTESLQRVGENPGHPLTAHQVGEAVVALKDVRVRDTVMHRLLVRWAHEPSRWADLGVALLTPVADTPRGLVAPLATMCGLACWLGGNGALALECLSVALSDDEEYSLGNLLLAGIDGGLPPAAWAEALRGLTEDECRHGLASTPGHPSGAAGRQAS